MSSAADRVLRAFLEVFSQNDGYVVFGQRGGSPGYVHIIPMGFDPSKPKHRHLAVELHNGAVAVTAELKDFLGAHDRPNTRIQDDPIGHGAGPKYGRFKWGLTHDEILARWDSERAFAMDVKKHLLALNQSRSIEADEGGHE